MRSIAIAITVLSLGAFTGSLAGEIKNAPKASTASGANAKTATVSQAKTCPAEATACCSAAKNQVTKKSQPASKGATLLVRR